MLKNHYFNDICMYIHYFFITFLLKKLLITLDLLTIKHILKNIVHICSVKTWLKT